MSQYESIWIKDPMNIIRFYDSFSINTSLNKFNAMIRCLMIIGTISILFNNYDWIYISLIGIIVISGIGYIYDDHIVKTNIEKAKKEYLSCRRSTINNPMSNVLPYGNNPMLKACVEDKKIIEDNLYHGFLRDQNDDVAEQRMRDFITMPQSSIIDDRDNFLEFIYNGYEEDGNEYLSCKYDGVNCNKYKDLRYTF